ncbi:hypothetical protein CHCC15087_3833 [Bacillus licheniformis]|nr:hypothetical protein CHCC15543_0767 [Bacillus licheniformis]TWM14264.1 hypothetical protein CHCC15087_3833 [Bacillus licheniformis]
MINRDKKTMNPLTFLLIRIIVSFSHPDKDQPIMKGTVVSVI